MNSLCQKDNHDLQKVKYLCIDQKCTHQDKLGCADCFLSDHAAHQRVHTEEFINQATLKIADLKASQSESLLNSIQDLNETIEQEFERCAGGIVCRFEEVKAAIKLSVENDVAVIQAKQTEINEEIESEAKRINELIEKPLYELSDDQINQLTTLYHDFSTIQNKHQTQIDQLRQQRDFVKAKKQKHLKKLSQVVNILLREFGDNLSPSKDTDEEDDKLATPEKKRVLSSNIVYSVSQNSNTKSPPDIAEIVRSGRRNYNPPQKKVAIKKKVGNNDD